MTTSILFKDPKAAGDAMRASVKPGNGCWLIVAADGAAEVRDAKLFGLVHLPAMPAPVYKSEKQKARALRKRHWANHKRWAAAGREPKAECQARMAEQYARWICERDSVAIPDGVNHVVMQHDWLSEEQAPGASWNERKRVKAVIFCDAKTDRWGSKRIDYGYTPLLTVEIPHWDHTPQMTEAHDMVDARDELTPRPFALPMIAEAA